MSDQLGRRVHKPYLKGDKKEFKSYFSKVGVYGLKSIDSGRLNSVELESALGVLGKLLKKKGKIIVNVIANGPITSKPAEVRMGKGKGKNSGNVCLVRKGMVIIEVICDSKYNTLVKKAFSLVNEGIGLRTKFIKEII